jgi:hypothetical protein
LDLPDVAYEQVSKMSIIPREFRAHVKAHHTVIDNERWFRKGDPFLGKAFTVKKTVKRHIVLNKILSRAAKRAIKAADNEFAASYQRLHSTIKECRPRRRCGSSACPKCARAFQRAKVDAEQIAIAHLAKARPDKHLVFVTIIPRGMNYYPGQFSQINILKANRWLKDVFERHGIRRVILGSVDLGWEKRRRNKYIQLHWHLAMWTSNPKALKAKLKAIFPKAHKYERPVDVKMAKDSNFVGYMNKLIRLPHLLRCGRGVLPELSLLLNRTEPFDFLFLKKLRLSAQSGGIVLNLINSIERRNAGKTS